jgi:hypothetical protein
MGSEKDYAIYFIENGVKRYYTKCYFKPFMPGLINAFLYRDRESAETDLAILGEQGLLRDRGSLGIAILKDLMREKFKNYYLPQIGLFDY